MSELELSSIANDTIRILMGLPQKVTVKRLLVGSFMVFFHIQHSLHDFILITPFFPDLFESPGILYHSATAPAGRRPLCFRAAASPP
jgi:hypothetical protein